MTVFNIGNLQVFSNGLFAFSFLPLAFGTGPGQFFLIYQKLKAKS